MMDFKRMFEPKSIAVIGVSLKNNRHPANVIYNKNNLRYPVKVFPVNPNGGMLHGEKIYSGISEIPEKVDLAIIAVRAEHCPDIIADCIKAEVGGAVVISGGFSRNWKKRPSRSHGRHGLRRPLSLHRAQLSRDLFSLFCRWPVYTE
jgi:acyl-CoA synthetase (NDP forming)